MGMELWFCSKSGLKPGFPWLPEAPLRRDRRHAGASAADDGHAAAPSGWEMEQGFGQRSGSFPEPAVQDQCASTFC